jgi:hypothetical protein
MIKNKEKKRDRVPYFSTIEKMMSCVPIAVCSSSATFVVIEIPPNPKSILVPTVFDSPAGISIVPLLYLYSLYEFL